MIFYNQTGFIRENLLAGLTIRFLIWTLPVFLFIYFSRKNIFNYLKIGKDSLRGIKWGILIGLAILMMQTLGSYIVSGEVTYNFDIGANSWVGGIILVGFSEEVLFRGFIQNEFERKWNFRKANLFQGILFLLVHFPGWLLLGMYSGTAFAKISLTIFLTGLLFGFVYKKTNSLWAVIILHSLNNFTSLVITV